MLEVMTAIGTGPTKIHALMDTGIQMNSLPLHAVLARICEEVI